MQIVIDIDDDLYTRLFDNGENDAVDMLKACATIRKGNVFPKGRWEYRDVMDAKRCVLSCSNCGYRNFSYGTPYCPNCGAKMEV